jgi:hypothetical protein
MVEVASVGNLIAARFGFLRVFAVRGVINALQ